ncbi:cation transporter [Marinicauda algicola]|uniref:Cation transporter n=2 Tax=Marinicauda algicola TaxID=2029849 RepID=A0A4S2GZE6_9PROT|nr:cation transporter [Marinicauda algicola]
MEGLRMSRGAHLATGLRRTGVLAAVWLALTGAAPDALAAGALALALAVPLSLVLLAPAPHPVRLARFAALAPGFLARSFQGGIDVAWRALHPDLPIRPGWIEFPTRIEDGPARLIFGSEISLLPGTLSAGSEDGALYVHALDASGEVEGSLRPREDAMARAFSQPRAGGREEGS